MPPTINSVTPTTGLSLGESFVTIDGTGFELPSLTPGGSVIVRFGGVQSPQAGAIDANTIIAVTPGGDVGPVDVEVENVVEAAAVTLVGGYTYVRPVLATRQDGTTDSAPLIVGRELLRELRRTVLQEIYWDAHPEFVTPTSALTNEELQATVPHLKIVGPSVSEDRFYAHNGRFDIQTVPGTPTGSRYEVNLQPVTVRLDFQYVGLARSKGEAMNLWAALTRFIDRTPRLEVPQDGRDKNNGVISFELNPIWEQRGEFSARATRSGDYQFNGALVVRGVHTVGGKVFEGAGFDGPNGEGEPSLTVENIPPV